MDDVLPVALLHLREAEVVRLCGLARAARGQDWARAGKVHQAERSAGTLRATVLEGGAARAVQARFSDSGLDAWDCVCSPAAPDQTSSSLAIRPPCEHVAALLSLWVRKPEQFRRAERAADDSAASVPARRTPLALAEADKAADEAAAAPVVPDSPVPALVHNFSMPVPMLAPNGADLERLDEPLRPLLNLLALSGGSVTVQEAQRLFVRLELGEPEVALAALERLQEAGFVQPVFAAASPSSIPKQAAATGNQTGWAIPDAVLSHILRVVPLEPLSEAPDLAQPAPGLTVQRADLVLPRLLVLLAAQVVDRSVPEPQTAASQPPALHSLVDVDATLADQWAPRLEVSPEQARFGLALLRALGMLPQTAAAWTREQRAAALARPPFSAEQARELLLRVYRLALARPAAEVARDLFAQWLHAESARELVELRDAGVRVAWQRERESRHAPNIAAENLAARRFIVDLLRWVPAGRWWSFSSLVEFVWRFQPGFLRGRQQTFLRPQWWLERLPGGQPLAMDERAAWRQAEGRYIALLLRRALCWLGVVELALDEQGRLKGFRVTPLGAFLLGTAARGKSGVPMSANAPSPPERPEPERPDALQVQDDGILLAALDALPMERLEMLLWWCEPAGATATALRFRPSARAFAAALDAGQDLAAWRAWLRALPPSAALTALLDDIERWAARYGQVRLVDGATLLEVIDPALLPELEATLDLARQYIDHRLAPGLAVLRSDAVVALLEELRRRGYSPWVTDDETTDRP